MPPAESATVPGPLIAPVWVMELFTGVAKTKAPLLETAPGSEPAFVPPSPICNVPCEIVVPPLKLLLRWSTRPSRP